MPGSMKTPEAIKYVKKQIQGFKETDLRNGYNNGHLKSKSVKNGKGHIRQFAKKDLDAFIKYRQGLGKKSATKAKTYKTTKVIKTKIAYAPKGTIISVAFDVSQIEALFEHFPKNIEQALVALASK